MWRVEVLPVPHGWRDVYEGRTERIARDEFAKIESECASNQRGHTEIKLWNGTALMLHIWWNRGIPNHPDGKRDWSLNARPTVGAW